MTDSAIKPEKLQNQGPPGWVYIVTLLPPVLLSVAVAVQPYVEPAELFRDPLAVAYDAAARGECCHAYYGVVSQLGAIIWSGALFISLFAAVCLYARSYPASAWRFMASASLLTAVLVADDVFQGHEFIYPTLFGLSEPIVVGIYLLLLALYLWGFRRQIIGVGPGLLIISLLAFGVSVGSDLFVSDDVSWHRLAEDGSKLLGICAWTSFHWWAAQSCLSGESAR